MKVTAERIPESKVLLRIEVPPDEVEEAIEKTYRDLSRRMRIPGFRPGKAPRSLVERYLGGPEIVQREGIDRLIDDSYRRALRDTDTHPIGEPDLSERPEFHPGEPLVFEATVPVAPRVELGDYRSLRMQPVAVEVTPEQVNRFLDDLREANAEWVVVERGARDGDQVLLDVLGVAGTIPTLYGPHGETLLRTEGGREVYNVTEHLHQINLQGPAEFAPGFDEELIGLTAGSTKQFGLTLPVDFPDASLANQSIVFEVKVRQVKEKHLPEVDDAFAQKVGGGSTVAELRETIRSRLQASLEREARSLYENALVEAVVGRSTVEVPEVMVERQIDAQIEDLKTDLARERIVWQDYLERTRTTDQKVREEMREPALRTIRGYLVLREVARREGIQVTPAEVSAEIDRVAGQFGRARQVVRERLSTRDQRERIEFRLFYEKAIRRLAEIAQQPAPGEPAAGSPEAPAVPEAREAVPPSGEDIASTEPLESSTPEAEVVASAPTNEETPHG